MFVSPVLTKIHPSLVQINTFHSAIGFTKEFFPSKWSHFKRILRITKTNTCTCFYSFLGVDPIIVKIFNNIEHFQHFCAMLGLSSGRVCRMESINKHRLENKGRGRKSRAFLDWDKEIKWLLQISGDGT